ncbi:hypothetical protein [Streptomyces canus]|uniref:hypothetical protein n=1 Tax=Streptomyces canus TaxID=58343 RepID=UPI00386F58EB|nr:hypothetical protein OH824_14000 [Streptomyces canus]
MTYKIEGPFPLTLRATETGADLDISRFLVKALFTELITQAAEDPEGVVEELTDMGELLRSALHQGPDSHARHEFDERMDKLVDTYADGGSVPLYATGLHQLRDAVVEIATPRPVPGQREAGAA